MSEPSPRGFYYAHDVGQLAGVSGRTIGAWKRRGYIRASLSHVGYPNVYSYQDIAEAMVVHELLENDVPLRNIRKLLTDLRAEYQDVWPRSTPTCMCPRLRSGAAGGTYW